MTRDLNKKVARLSVFVCSRMDELTSSRRAAVHAIVDSDALPVIFEAEFLNPVETPEERVRQSRRRIDSLLMRSDCLVMLLSDTLGEGLSAFAGLTASEFEFYRFIYQWYLHDTLSESRSNENKKEVWAEVKDELDRVFVSSEHNGRVPPPLAKIRRMIDEDLAKFTRNEGEGPFSRIVRDRVKVLMKRLRGDRPISRHLMEFASTKPLEYYGSAVVGSETQGLSSDVAEQQVFNPPPVTLYSHVADWLEAIADKGLERGTEVQPATYYSIESSRAGGFLQTIAKVFRDLRYNIEDVIIAVGEGRRELLVKARYFDYRDREDVVCKMRPDNMQYSTDRELQLLQNLQRSGGVAASLEAKEWEQRAEQATEMERQGKGPGRELKLDPVRQYEIHAGNVPGLLLRVLASIAKVKGVVAAIRRVDVYGDCFAKRTTRVMTIGWQKHDAETGAVRRLLHVLSSRVGMLHCRIVPGGPSGAIAIGAPTFDEGYATTEAGIVAEREQSNLVPVDALNLRPPLKEKLARLKIRKIGWSQGIEEALLGYPGLGKQSVAQILEALRDYMFPS